jgi:hypothetical protein
LVDSTGNESAGIRLSYKPNETAGHIGSDVQWGWSAPPTENIVNELRAGALVVWLKSDPHVEMAVPLCGPTRGPAFSLIEGMVNGVEFTPHAAFGEEAKSVKNWDAAAVGYSSSKATAIAERDDATSELWRPPLSANNPTKMFSLNPEHFEQVLLREIEQRVSGVDDAKDATSKLIKRVFPVDVEVRMDVHSTPDAKDGKMLAGVQLIVFLRTSDGTKTSRILQCNPHNTDKPSIGEFEKQVRAELAGWLAQVIEVPLPDTRDLDKGFDKNLGSLNRWEDRVQVLFAQHVFDSVLGLLDYQIKFEVQRKAKLQTSIGTLPLEICAHVGE